MSPVRPTLQVVGRRLEAEHHRLRDFLTRIAQPHEWFEAGSQEAVHLLERLGLADDLLPVVVDGDRTFTRANVEMLAAAWTQHASPQRTQYGPYGASQLSGFRLSIRVRCAVDAENAHVVHTSVIPRQVVSSSD